jgi:hypothetical protein
MLIKEKTDISNVVKKTVTVEFDGVIYWFLVDVLSCDGVRKLIKNKPVNSTFSKLPKVLQNRIRKEIKLYFESCNSEKNN